MFCEIGFSLFGGVGLNAFIWNGLVFGGIGFRWVDFGFWWVRL